MSQDVDQEQHHEPRQQYEIKEIDKEDECDQDCVITDFDTRMVKVVYSSEDETADEAEDDSGDVVQRQCHANEKTFVCCYCDFTTPVKFKFGEHMQNNHGFTVKPFEFDCHECKKRFTSWPNLRRHKVNVHQKKIRNYKCSFCQFNSRSRTGVRKHSEEHVESAYHPCKSKELGYGCRYCHQMFWTVLKLNEHTLNWHSDKYSEDFLLCNFCLATFVNKTALRLHYSFQHPNMTQFGEYLFMCKICHVGYATLNQIQSHMLDNHPAHRSTYCDRNQCRFNIIDANNLQAHVSSIHKTKVYLCVGCSRQFKTQNNVIKHFELSHGDLEKTDRA